MSGAYLILGTPGAGRREVTFDLIDGGLPDNPQVDVFISNDEADSPFDEQLASLDNVDIISWDASDLAHAPAPGEDSTVFFITDSASDFRDQLEAFKRWTEAYRIPVLRIIVVVDCQLAESTPALTPWYAAQLHFADVVLLNRREEVSNKWIRDFEISLKKQHMPCQCELVKKGKVRNPPSLLHPEPRRVSHYFDETDGFEHIELDEDNLPDEPIEIGEKTDPYLARLDSGQRTKLLPDIREFLQKDS